MEAKNKCVINTLQLKIKCCPRREISACWSVPGWSGQRLWRLEAVSESSWRASRWPRKTGGYDDGAAHGPMEPALPDPWYKLTSRHINTHNISTLRTCGMVYFLLSCFPVHFFHLEWPAISDLAFQSNCVIWTGLLFMILLSILSEWLHLILFSSQYMSVEMAYYF